MPNVNYQTGRSRENYIRDLFEEHEWMVVRSAGSKGAFDLVVHKTGFDVYVQAKPSRTRSIWKEYLQLAVDKRLYALIVWKQNIHYDAMLCTPYAEVITETFPDMLSYMDEIAYETAQLLSVPSVDTLV